MVATPGFETVWADAVPLTEGGRPQVGYVLETFAGGGFVGAGTHCSVLLIESFQILPIVLVPMGAGSGSSRLHAIAPQPSTTGLLAVLNSAFAGLSAFPSAQDGGAGWGSKVLVRFLAGGIPYLDQYLPHPGAVSKQSPQLAAKTTEADTAGQRAALVLREELDEVPDDLSDADAVVVPDVPAPFAESEEQAEQWRAAFVSGYLGGAERGYDGGTPSDPPGALPDGLDPWAKLRDSGYRTGWAVGQVKGIAARAAKPPEAPPIVSPVSLPVEYNDPSDTEDDDHVSGLPTGDDVVWEHDGVRMILRSGGGFTVDSRNGGPIDFQASPEGTRISAGGTVMMVGKDAVTVAKGGAAAQETIRGTRLVEWLQTEASFQTAMGPSGPLAQPAPTDLKTDAVKVT